MAKKKAPLVKPLWPDEVRPHVTILVNAGVVDRDSGVARFISSVPAGTRGAYVGPHPTLGSEGWHLVDVLQGYVPLHRSQFERVRD